MALYMIQFAYTAEAWATLAKNPQDRSVPIRELLQKLGGRLVGVYYCFGEYDGVVLAEIPDDISAIATSLAAVSPGVIHRRGDDGGDAQGRESHVPGAIRRVDQPGLSRVRQGDAAELFLVAIRFSL